MKTLLTLSTLKILSVYIFISLPLFLSFMNCPGDRGLFSGFCSRPYIDKYVDTRTFSSDTYLIFENFFYESNSLMEKISKNKKFLKLVKEYIQIFSGCFEQFFDFAKIMLFAKLKSFSKRFEKIQTYTLNDSKNFLFLVISSVCLYFLTKKILDVFVKILQFGCHFVETKVKNEFLNHMLRSAAALVTGTKN